MCRVKFTAVYIDYGAVDTIETTAVGKEVIRYLVIGNNGENRIRLGIVHNQYSNVQVKTIHSDTCADEVCVFMT